MARILRITLAAAMIAALMCARGAEAQECTDPAGWNSCRISGSHPPAVGYCCGPQQTVCYCANPLSEPPTPAAPPMPPTPAPMVPGDYKACLFFTSSANGIQYFDMRSTPASGTTLLRYGWNNAIGNLALVDSNWYAALHLPPGLTDDLAAWPETTWNEGVAYAATMQSRGVWAYTEPTLTATWQRFTTSGVSEDAWRFYYTPSGSSTSTYMLFGRSMCFNATERGAGVFDPNRERRACLTSGSMYYDVRTSPSAGTTLRRIENGALVDTNTYAALHGPSMGTITWDEGVAFAATMQSRHAWVNMEPTQAATWQIANGEDIMRFSTTVNGAPTELVFRTSQCTY